MRNVFSTYIVICQTHNTCETYTQMRNVYSDAKHKLDANLTEYKKNLSSHNKIPIGAFVDPKTLKPRSKMTSTS